MCREACLWYIYYLSMYFLQTFSGKKKKSISFTVFHTWSGQAKERREISRIFPSDFRVPRDWPAVLNDLWSKRHRAERCLPVPMFMWVGWLPCGAGLGIASKLSSCENSSFLQLHTHINITLGDTWNKDVAGGRRLRSTRCERCWPPASCSMCFCAHLCVLAQVSCERLMGIFMWKMHSEMLHHRALG